MKTTTAREFRAKLKTYMDATKRSSVLIHRRGGNACVLISDQEYAHLTGHVFKTKKGAKSKRKS